MSEFASPAHSEAAGAPWPPGAATGIGSLPGTDIVEAIKTVFGELPDLPYLPELPASGPGADMIGRTAGLLVDLAVELYAARWRLSTRPGRDARRTADLRERDLDALTAHAAGYAGTLKVQAAGPWTMAASLELRTGGSALGDAGAVRDLAASLAEGLRTHLAELAVRVPGARLLLQLDEPTLPAVLAGRVPTESGLATLAAPDRTVAVEVLRAVVDAAAVPVVVHCCAADPPVALLQQAGAAAVAVDLDQFADLDVLGEALDSGLGLFAGAVPARPAREPVLAGRAGRAALAGRAGEAAPGRTNGAAFPGPSGRPATSAGEAAAGRVRSLWRRVGFPDDQLPVQVVVTQACGLAGADPDYARTALAAARSAARELAAG